MPTWVSAALDVAPWAMVALFAISKVYRLAMAWIVRTSPTDMTVEDHLRSFDVRRGEADRPGGPPQLGGLAPPALDDGSAKQAKQRRSPES